jgi:predicted phosphodiesterase
MPALLLLALVAQSHFAILGDRTGRAVPKVYEEAWREIVAAHPEFVVTVGDSIEGMDDSRARAEWEALKQVWPQSLKIYQTPGNHDIWDDQSARLFTEETGDSTSYSFDVGGAHFVVLDNSRTEDLSAAQLDFLQKDLERRQGNGPTLIFFHRPFWLIPMKLHMTNFRLHQLARQYGVCCVISGHGHQFQTLAQDGVLYLEVGSSGASLAQAGPAGIGYQDGWFYQYVYATVNGSSVDFEVRELSPPFGRGRVRVLHAGSAGTH